jgi:serine/threonine-protein kinase
MQSYLGSTATYSLSEFRRRVERPVPARPDRWELVSLAANGAMTQVYRARPIGAGQQGKARYAVKILKATWLCEPAAVAMFARELEVGSKARHRSLVSVLGGQADETSSWIAMPWLDGRTMAARLARGPVAPGTAFWWARQIAEAIDTLDRAGWVHGDIKPANVIVSDGRATLVDLGFAHRRRDGRTSECLARGTPAYMAPETIISTLGSDVRSDLYSLGVIMYEALAGRRPFRSTDLAEILLQHRECRPRPLQSLVPHLPKAATDLVDSMLAKDPLRRPQTAAEVIDVLVQAEIATLAERTI